MSVDWFAVDCVLNGTRLPLTAEERRMAIRRFMPRMVPVGGVKRTLNDLTTEEIGYRIGCTPRHVERITAELPPAEKLRCDVCGETMWVLDGDVIEAHADEFYQECPMSGAVFEADPDSELAHTTLWLSRRLRGGGSQKVWEYVERLPVTELRRLLMAALAGVADSEDPFAWLKEAV